MQPFIYIALESGSPVDSEGDKRKGAVGMVFQTENRGQREDQGTFPLRLKGSWALTVVSLTRNPLAGPFQYLNPGGIPNSFREVLG